MMKRYFKDVQPHINIAKLEAKIAFLPGLPEIALKIANKFSSHERLTEQREFVTYKCAKKGINLYYPKTKQE